MAGEQRGGRAVRRVRPLVGLVVLVVAAVYLSRVVESATLARALRALAADPLGLALALVAYAAAFVLRALVWTRVLPGLSLGQSWAALHVSLLGNHVLPLRLGEALRVTSVLRRTDLPLRPVLASAVLLRLADVATVLLLALVAAPALLGRLATSSGRWVALGGLLVVVVLATAAAADWVRRLRRRGAELRLPGPGVASVALLAWVLESLVVAQVAASAGVPLSFGEAVAVTAVTIAAQLVAVTPGGFGSYEAAATAALAGLGVPAGQAFAVALSTHAVKTGYALATGLPALVRPSPPYWGRLRLPRRLPERPRPAQVAEDARVVAFVPAHDEEATVGDVVGRLPRTVAGRALICLVVDDGSTDRTAEVAEAAGAHVLRQPANLGLGAAVRRGLAEASALGPACVVYLDADAEYDPADIEAVAAPVLSGAADYVVGSRSARRDNRMRTHRRLGNRLLTAWVRWMTRNRSITDGQSGYRAFSPHAAAHADVVHDYNYAQVLTLDLLGKGYRYAEVPISYTFRTTGTSFVRPGRYLRRVVPAVHRQLNPPRTRPELPAAGSVGADLRPAVLRPAGVEHPGPVDPAVGVRTEQVT